MCQKSAICTPNFFHFWEGLCVPGFALFCITPWPILYLNKNYIIKSVMVWGRYPYRFIKNCFKNNILWCYNYKHFLLDFVKMATSDDNEAHQIIIQYSYSAIHDSCSDKWRDGKIERYKHVSRTLVYTWHKQSKNG